jgi:membrane protein involved in colicin uptake
MVSLTLYNRRQRTLWIERENEILNQARIAQANGVATAEQIELVKQDDIEIIYKQKKAEEKAQRPWAKAKRFLFDKMNPEDAGTTAVQAAAAATTSAAEATQSSVIDAVKAKQAFDAAAAKTGSSMPGQLDVMAENAERAAKEKTRSWTSWLTGR